MANTKNPSQGKFSTNHRDETNAGKTKSSHASHNSKNEHSRTGSMSNERSSSKNNHGESSFNKSARPTSADRNDKE